ncbi:MAG: hypothetical protein JWQ20_3191 [Conexibacter sp.]|nr:hypothetical protein [Conexibacter sp.]
MSSVTDISVKWVDFDDEPIVFTNAFLVQHQPQEFVLSFGQVTGPPVIGTPDQVREAAAASPVPILPVARLGLTRHRVTELIALLQATLDDHDRGDGR